MVERTRYVLLILLLFSLLVPIPYQPYTIPSITNSQSVEFIPSGEYIVPITIHTSLSSPVYNYSLEIVLNAINFNGWDYINTSNIYFLDQNGHPLYYWIQELNVTGREAIIWVNTTLTNTTIYMLYGGYNPYPEYNNPDRVFLFYDDFEDSTKLTISTSGVSSYSYSTSYVIHGSYSLEYSETSTTSGGSVNGTTICNLGNSFMVQAWVRPAFTDPIKEQGIYLYISRYIRIGFHNPGATNSPEIDLYVNGTLAESKAVTNWVQNEWYLMQAIYSDQHITIRIYFENGTLFVEYTSTNTYTLTNNAVGFFIGTGAGQTGNAYIDLLTARKYIDPGNYTVSIGSSSVVSRYVIPITISTSLTSPVYNYSLRLEFNTTNIQNWDSVFGSGNASTIYVLDQNGTPLYYWVEKYDTTAKDVVLWINTTLTNETIYIYSEASDNPFVSYNNQNKVFLVYDDFDWSASLSNTGSGTYYIGHGWYVYSNAGDNAWSVSISGGIATISAKDTVSGNGASSTTIFYNGTSLNVPVAIVFNASCVNWGGVGSGSYYRSYALGMGYPGTSSALLIANENGRLLHTGNPAGYSNTGDLGTVDVSTFHKYKIVVTNTIAKIYYYDTTTNKWVFWGSKTDYLPNTTMYPQFSVSAWSGYGSYYLKISSVYAYKYVDPSNYTISISSPIAVGVIYSGYGNISPTSVYGVLSSINSYSYTVNFTVRVTNNGTVPQNYTLLVLNGNNVAVYNETVSVNAGDTYTSWFTYTFTSQVNTTWYYIVEANNTIYTNTTIPITIVEVSGAYVPIHITYYGSQPVPNYTLMLNLTSNNFNGWSYVGGNTTIGFLDSNGNPLYYWVDYLNTTEEQAIIYVNITLTNTTIYMYVNLDPNPLLQYDNPYRTFLWYDGFETWSGWVQYGSGVVSQTSSPVRHGSYALLKNSYGDPNGGYKQLPFTLNFPFILEAYVDRTGTSSAPVDRIGVIDNSGNGYGIARDSGAGTLYIDKRSSYSATTYGSTSLKVNPAVGEWYMMQFIWNNGNMIARMYLPPSYELIGSTSYSDTSYTSFTRVYVFGGYPYVVDDLRIRKYVDPSTFTVEIGSLVGIAGVVFTGSISPTNVTVSIPSVNATAYQLFNMTVSNIGNETGWAIMELVGDNNTVLYSNNVTLASGETYSAVYNATFTYSDHGIHTWYYIVKNDTKVFVNDTVTITVVINITLTFNYTQYFNQSILPSWVNSTWFNYTIDIPEPSTLEKWIPSMWYNYTQTAEATLNGVAWIQANSIPRIIGTNACITLYTNTTGNWTQVYHVCNSYAYYLVVEIVLEPVGVPADYPNAYISILVWDNSINDYRYIYSIYVPSGNQSVLLFANQYYKLEIPASGTTIHGYSFKLDKYVLDNNVVDPPSIYLDGSHVITIYYEIYSGTTPPPTTTTAPLPTTAPYPPPTVTFPYVTVPIVPPSANVSIPSSPNIGYPGLDTPEAVFSLLLYIALIVLFIKLFNVYQAVAVASGIMMILSIFLFGILAVWLYFILFIIAVALYWKLGGGG